MRPFRGTYEDFACEHAGEMFESEGRPTKEKWDKHDFYGRNRYPTPTEAWVGLALPNTSYESSLVRDSNRRVIEEELEEGDDVQYAHFHFWGESLLIRIRDEDGELTSAFEKFVDIVTSLQNYPLLNEDDHSQLEMERCNENIKDICGRWTDEERREDGWEDAVQGWLYENGPESLLENRDDAGCWPDEEWCKTALYDLELADSTLTDAIDNAIIDAFVHGGKRGSFSESASMTSYQINTIEDRALWVERGNYRTDKVIDIEDVSENETFCRWCGEQIKDTGHWAFEYHEPGRGADAWRDFAHIRCCFVRIDFDLFREDGKLHKRIIEIVKGS